MFADEIRLAIEASSRITLPGVTALLWQAFSDGKVSEAEAEALSVLIESRQASGFEHRLERRPNPGGTTQLGEVAQDSLGSPRTGTGSRPRTDASLERRRRWAASGRLPPALAARFTLAEQAVLALVAAETARRGDCRLAVGHLAAIVGVAETTVRNAIREARAFGLLTIEERRITGFRNDTNVIRIVSPEWVAWLRLGRRSPASGARLSLTRKQKGGGCKSPNRTPTKISKPGKTGTARPPRRQIAAHGRAS